MNPPFSVVFLTTLIGMGQGCFIALILQEWREPQLSHGALLGVGSLIVLLLLIAGLIASFFHLGHPERAWRAVARWRTSWLSREVIALPLFMAMVFAYCLTNWLPQFDYSLTSNHFQLHSLLAIGGFVAAVLLFVCTSMIYACLKFLQQWHTPFTMINFMLLGCCSGFNLAALTSNWTSTQSTNFFSIVAIILTVIAAISRILSLKRNKRLRPKSTLQSATGINNPNIKQISSGAMAPTFNRHQFNHGKKLGFIRSVKTIFILMTFIIPVILLSLSLLIGNNGGLLVLSVLCQYLGLVAERWYFFADANHPQNIYYQVIA